MMRIERLLDGLQPCKLYLIGARPGVGKTSFAGDIAIDLAKSGVGVMFFSCEMSKLQLQQRLLSTLTGVNPQKSISAPYTKQELQKIRDGVREMRGWNLWIDDTDRIDIDLLRSRARKAVTKDNVKCIIIDYITLVRGVEPKSRSSKKDEVGEVSGALKALSKELNVPVIALAQLKRTGNAYNSSSNATEIPKPNLESLKESGDLEQDADAVILLHRDMSHNASVAYAIVAKNRSGMTGEVELIFSNETTSFTENPIR
jgi:replicative DNA helicase